MKTPELKMKREKSVCSPNCSITFAPFVDIKEELFICVDGGAAHHHAGKEEAALKDAVLPTSG